MIFIDLFLLIYCCCCHVLDLDFTQQVVYASEHDTETSSLGKHMLDKPFTLYDNLDKGGPVTGTEGGPDDTTGLHRHNVRSSHGSRRSRKRKGNNDNVGVTNVEGDVDGDGDAV